MKGFKSKRGISLIVLVITIIVMIILAAAIILSISNSGIMDKANKAKTDSDTANLKEYVNVLDAEWELQAEGTESYSSKEAYVNAKLADKYPNAALGADGEVYTGLNEAARKAIAGGIQIGDVVTGYTLDTSDDKKTYNTAGIENTASNASFESVEQENTPQLGLKRIEYDEWKYIGIGENGEILIAPDMVDSVTSEQKIKLSGKGGYLNGPQVLNDMCSAMYSTEKGTARSMNIDDINRILDYTGKGTGYYDTNAKFTYTSEAMTIAEIANKIGYDMSYFNSLTPEASSSIGEYLSYRWYISKTSSDILKSLSTKEEANRKELLLNFVFTDNTYWLASSVVYANFDLNKADFCVCASTVGDISDSSGVYTRYYSINSSYTFSSYGESCNFNLAVRPVVSLGANVHLNFVAEGEWTL